MSMVNWLARATANRLSLTIMAVVAFAFASSAAWHEVRFQQQVAAIVPNLADAQAQLSNHTAQLSNYALTVNVYALTVNERISLLKSAYAHLANSADRMDQILDRADQTLVTVDGLNNQLAHSTSTSVLQGGGTVEFDLRTSKIAAAQRDTQQLRSELKALVNANASVQRLEPVPPLPGLDKQGSINRPAAYAATSDMLMSYTSEAHAQETTHLSPLNPVRLEVVQGVMVLLGVVLVVCVVGMFCLKDAKRNAQFHELTKLLIAFFIGVGTSGSGMG